MPKRSTIPESKKIEVQSIETLFKDYPVVGIANIENLPALQLQRIKKQLKKIIVLKMTKKRLIKIALRNLKGIKKDIEQLDSKLIGMPALIFTKENPFKLYKLLEKSKSSAKAKPGQISPRDITIPAGPTNFMPGPIIGELGQIGLKTEVKEGKVHIKEDVTVVKQNSIISAKQADILARLGIEPLEIGLNLVLTYENGEILTSDILAVNEEAYMNNIKIAYHESIALAINIGYITKDTLLLTIKRAFINAKALESKVEKLKPTKLEKEILEQIKPETAEQANEVKIELKAEVSKEDMEQAQQLLKELTDKKIKDGGK